MLKVVGNEAAHDGADGRSQLDEIAREGARRMLVAALETEVAAYLEAHRDERDDDGHALVVRNGKGRTRKVTVGAGTIPVSAPRVNDRRTDQDGERRRFTSRILPPYMRRSPKVAKDADVLLTFFDFPAEHWKHLRTRNVIESPFATVRLRQRVTKGAGSRTKGLLMAYKLLDMAQARWRRLDGASLLPLVRAGIVFVDGVQQAGRANRAKARAA